MLSTSSFLTPGMVANSDSDFAALVGFESSPDSSEVAPVYVEHGLKLPLDHSDMDPLGLTSPATATGEKTGASGDQQAPRRMESTG